MAPSFNRVGRLGPEGGGDSAGNGSDVKRRTPYAEGKHTERLTRADSKEESHFHVDRLADRNRESLGKKIVRNVLTSGVRALLVAPVPFVMTPLILHEVGAAGYGTWAVLLAINGMTSLADLGMVGTLSKHVAEYYARRDFAALDRLLSTGMLIFGLLSVVVALVLWVASPLIVRVLFRGSSVRNEEVLVLLRAFAFVVGANVLVLLFSSVTSGLQRLDLTSWIAVANVYVAALVGATLLFRGWGVRGLVTGQVSASLCVLCLYVLAFRRLLPQTKVSAANVNMAEAKKMFHFSLQLYVTQAASAIHNQIEKFLLAMFVGVGAAGWYDIASDIALKIRAVSGLVLGPILPAASELDALQGNQRLKELYFRAHKYLAFVGIPIVCYTVAISSTFVKLWIGPELAFIGVPLTILTVVNFYNLATGPGFLVFAGRGYLRPGVQSATVGISLNVILSLGLIYKFHFAGAVAGTAVSLFLASSYFIYLFHRDTSYSILDLLRGAYLKPLTISAALSAIVFIYAKTAVPSWAGVVLPAIGFGVFYVAIILFSRFFDRYDWSKVESLIPAMRYARRIIPVA